MGAEETNNMKQAIREVLKEDSRKAVDPRPTDLELFFSVLPHAIGSFASKLTDPQSANAMAFLVARQAVGQCITLGLARPTTMCTDGNQLGLVSSAASPMPGVQQPIQHNPATQGVMVAQQPNIPGQGMPVQQGAVVVGGVGQGGCVGQFPTQQQQMMVPYQGGPLGVSTGNGMKAVVTAMFPNDPSMHPPQTMQQTPPGVPGYPQQGFPQQPMQQPMQPQQVYPQQQPMQAMQPNMPAYGMPQQPMQQPMQGMPMQQPMQPAQQAIGQPMPVYGQQPMQQPVYQQPMQPVQQPMQGVPVAAYGGQTMMPQQQPMQQPPQVAPPIPMAQMPQQRVG